MKLNWKWRKHYLKLAWYGLWDGLLYTFEDLWKAIIGFNPERRMMNKHYKCNICRDLLVISFIDNFVAPCPACKAIPSSTMNKSCPACAGDGMVDGEPCNRCYPAYKGSRQKVNE